jgi:uncharacterized YigZ family protein
MTDSYKTIKNNSEGFFKDRNSKFFAFAFPVESEEQISAIQKDLRKKYYDARHHCYAYMLGHEKKNFRANDDGEPSNSSGQPILGQIRSFDLTNILIVVIRYFGGTKLGVPGLINAYKTAANEVLKNAEIIEKTIDDIVEFHFEYPEMNNVMRIIKEEELHIISHDFQLNCIIKTSVRKSQTEKVINRLHNFHNIKYLII